MGRRRTGGWWRFLPTPPHHATTPLPSATGRKEEAHYYTCYLGTCLPTLLAPRHAPAAAPPRLCLLYRRALPLFRSMLALCLWHALRRCRLPALPPPNSSRTFNTTNTRTRCASVAAALRRRLGKWARGEHGVQLCLPLHPSLLTLHLAASSSLISSLLPAYCLVPCATALPSWSLLPATLHTCMAHHTAHCTSLLHWREGGGNGKRRRWHYLQHAYKRCACQLRLQAPARCAPAYITYSHAYLPAVY